jgi:hypothetical protein
VTCRCVWDCTHEWCGCIHHPRARKTDWHDPNPINENDVDIAAVQEQLRKVRQDVAARRHAPNYKRIDWNPKVADPGREMALLNAANDVLATSHLPENRSERGQFSKAINDLRRAVERYKDG